MIPTLNIRKLRPKEAKRLSKVTLLACGFWLKSTALTRQSAASLQDISTQLLDILDNVNCVINRFQEELGYDLKENAKSHQTDPKGKKRFILLDKIASFSKDAKMKEKHLYDILRWLGDWGEFAGWAPCLLWRALGQHRTHPLLQ